MHTLDLPPLDPAAHPPLLRPALVLALLCLLLFGLGYSLTLTGLAQWLFPAPAHGSVLQVEGQVRGAQMVAQPFTDPRYFAPRPSAAQFDPRALAGSNQARSHPELLSRLLAARTAMAEREGAAVHEVPWAAVSQSGSGIDPHLPPVAARLQVARVARARGVPAEAVMAVLAAQVEGPQWGVLGQPRVNVLALNLALDQAFPPPSAAAPVPPASAAQ